MIGIKLIHSPVRTSRLRSRYQRGKHINSRGKGFSEMNKNQQKDYNEEYKDIVSIYIFFI